jgi:hypothetical protein
VNRIHIAEKVISKVVGRGCSIEIEPTYDTEDSILPPPKALPTKEGKASCDETIDKLEETSL